MSETTPAVEVDPSNLLADQSVQFIITLMGAQMNGTSASWANLAHSFAIGERKKQAQLALVRSGVKELLDGPYMPNLEHIRARLYPGEAAVEQWLADHYGEPDKDDTGGWMDPATTHRRCWRCDECNW